MENRKLTLVKAKGRGAGARCEEIEKGEDGGRDGEGKTVAEEVGASGLVETLMVEGSTVTSGSFGLEVRDLFLECRTLQI